MKKNKSSMFKKLYIEEMKDIKQELFAIVVFALVCNIALLIWPDSSIIVAFAMTLVFMSSGIVPIISSVKSLSHDWNNNTIYLLKSLPVSGVMVISAKTLASFTEFFIATLAVSVFSILGNIIQITTKNPVLFSIEWDEFITELGKANAQVFFKIVFLVYLTILVGFIYLVSMIFLSQMIARIKGKYMRLVSYISFAGLVYIGGKIASWVMMNLPWVQNLDFIPPEQIPANLVSVFLSAILIIVLLSAFMLIGAGIIYDKKVEL